MSDFGVLSALRQHLGADPQIERVFLTIPPKALMPFVQVEPEEMCSYLTPGGLKGYVKTQISIHSQSLNAQEILHLAERVRWRLEGAKLTLGPASTGVVKITSVVMDAPPPGQPRVIHQFYTVLVRS